MSLSSFDTSRLTGEVPPQVRACGERLQHLDGWLATVTLIGKVTSPTGAVSLYDSVNTTRERFRSLREKLVSALVEAHAGELEMKLGSLAQVAVDILIRNLFERTADVGFLATDPMLRAFLAGGESAPSEADLAGRLEEYVAKYSVYDNILLLSTQGEVRWALHACPGAQCDAALMADLARNRADYLEVCRPSPLLPALPEAHLFLAPVLADDQPGSRCLGLLCLSFNLQDEMTRLFAQLCDAHQHLALLTPDGHVVASSLAALPAGMPLGDQGRGRIGAITLQGRRYLCRAVEGQPYQGYAGLGWRCMALLEQRDAFARGDAGVTTLMATGGEATTRHRQGVLAEICDEAADVAQRLSLTVLNGRITSAQCRLTELTPVLQQVREIGYQTRQVFDESIASLQNAMTQVTLADAAMRSFSMIDIMDRNLYERANDVRWWALDNRIRHWMQVGGAEAGRHMSRVLEYINRLYTVYTNLLVFDTEGVIRAVSSPESSALVGTRLPEALPLQACLALGTSQAYAVSAFAPTPLYDGQATYLYMARVTSAEDGRVLGGMATVFDAAPELSKIVTDNLPSPASSGAAAFGLLVQPDTTILASSEACWPVGERLDAYLPISLAVMASGQRRTQWLEHGGRSYLVGLTASAGYREYKVTDGYCNDVVALACLPVA